MSERIISVDASSFENIVIKDPQMAVVYFYSDDCLPCQTFTPIFERLAQALSDRIRFIKVFRSHNRALADQYGIKFSPTLLFFKDGREACNRLTGYISFQEFKESLDYVLESKCPTNEKDIIHCDVLIVGAGPAGLTAAIYAARSRLYTVVVDTNIPGGQVATTFHVANYPGTNGPISGLELAENMKKQALSFGAQIDDMQSIQLAKLASEEKHIQTEHCDYYAKTVIIATGSEPRKLPVPEERDFRGRGIHYCATCDGALYTDTDLIVVGGGTSAVEEAVFLTSYARTVTIINRSDAFKAAQSSVDAALKNPQIKVFYNSVIKQVIGDQFVESVILEDVKTGETRPFKTDGIFVYIGTVPNSSLFKDVLDLSEQGYIKADEHMSTNIPGVFAAGDIRDKEIRQITTAVSDGTIAGIMAERYINRK